MTAPFCLADEDYLKTIRVPENGITDPETKTADSLSISDERIRGILIPEICIHKRNLELARNICKETGDESPLQVLVVLTGAFVFAADLCRTLFREFGRHVRYHLIRTATYGREIKASGETDRTVRVELSPKSIAGKDLLIIEDIIDQGFTLEWILDYLLSEGARSVRLCCLLDKHLDDPPESVARRRRKIVPDHIGVEIPDIWVAGYGIDAGEDFRNLPHIVAVNEKCYA